MADSKICARCKKKKPKTEFWKKSNESDKLNSYCKDCVRWLRKNKWYKNNQEERRQKNLEYARSEHARLLGKISWLKTRYGITLEDYNKMFQEQQGCCIICGKHQSEFGCALGVEHNHATGQIRGLACVRCNHLVDVYEKNFYGFKNKIADYLRKHNE